VTRFLKSFAFTREDVGTGLNSITHVHRYYEEWAKSNTEKNLPFQNLWENVMIRSTSEAICETVGSMMAQHGAKNHSLQPKNFNIEMYLRFNLPTLHHSDGLVNEVLTFDKKRLIKGEKRIARLPSKDITKSSTISTFEVKDETKSRLPELFWNPSPSK